MRLLFIVMFLMKIFVGFSQDMTAYESHIFFKAGSGLPYRLLLPQHLDSSRRYPLIVFLHGANQKGNDNEAQLAIGGRFFLRQQNRDSFPAVIIFPQCPENDAWADFSVDMDSATHEVKRLIFPFGRPTRISATLIQLVDSFTHLGFVNNKQVYIAGLSQGGMGVLDLIARYPNTFAAALSICGVGDISTAKRFAGRVALWLFHGNKDDVIPVYYSREYYKKLKKEKADVRYSEYENVFHNSWVNALNEPRLLQWLFSKSK